MFKLNRKVMLGIVIVGLICLVGPKGYAQAVSEREIIDAFQDAMNEVMYPQEFPLFELSDQEIRDYLLPSLAEIVAKTMSLAYEKFENHIDAEDVFAALPPKLEEHLDSDKEKLILEIKDILRGKLRTR